MHVTGKAVAVCGLMLALSALCMALGSVIEMNTLFLLAAASFFVGIVIREFGLRLGAAFYLGDVLLGFLISPNKLYVITFAAMGVYLWGREALWFLLSRAPLALRRPAVFLAGRLLIFNAVYLPLVFFFWGLFFSWSLGAKAAAAVIVGGQIGLLVFDSAYEYTQRHIWERYRRRLLH